MLSNADIDAVLKPLTIKDLRVQCRARGLNPAGGVEPLRDRIKENMNATKDFGIKSETGEDMTVVQVTAGQASNEIAAGGKASNNYARPGGQNVGNFLTERNSSKVMEPPGGRSQICFGDSEPQDKGHNNNYARPGGQQNVGNFLTDRNSSKVMAPPGGKSQITFG